MEHDDQLGVYLGALGFTKPLEQLMLHTVPLQSLLDWLFEPQGPSLVETLVTAAPYKALAIAVTKRMLYEEKPPLVGVGLMYKPHYISTVPFSVAYMHLNVWHSTASHKESEKRLDVPRLLFVNISEMSDVIPVVVRHPILLDWASREAMEGTVGPGSHHSFQGFRLHTTQKQPPTGGLTHHIALPHVLGENNASLVKYELEKFPQALMQGLKIATVLKPPAQDHWNIALDPSSLGYWWTPGVDVKLNKQPRLKKRDQRRQGHLNQRYLLMGSLLESRLEVVVSCSQRRWFPIGSES